jgi:hypothetical protein
LPNYKASSFGAAVTLRHFGGDRRLPAHRERDGRNCGRFPAAASTARQLQRGPRLRAGVPAAKHPRHPPAGRRSALTARPMTIGRNYAQSRAMRSCGRLLRLLLYLWRPQLRIFDHRPSRKSSKPSPPFRQHTASTHLNLTTARKCVI